MLTTLVIPCYNEAARFNAAAFHSFLRKSPSVRLQFVNDGSGDGTGAVLDAFARECGDAVRVLHLPENSGKAEAVRRGVLAAMDGSEWVGFWDADLATPLEELDLFIEAIGRDPALLIVAGSRVRKMGSNIERHWYRHYLGRIFATAASMILAVPVYDTQCGAKLIHTALAREIFAQPFTARWLFDVELFARAIRLLGPKKARGSFLEVPLATWRDVAGSKLRLRHFVQAPFQLFRIWRLNRR